MLRFSTLKDYRAVKCASAEESDEDFDVGGLDDEGSASVQAPIPHLHPASEEMAELIEKLGGLNIDSRVLHYALGDGMEVR